MINIYMYISKPSNVGYNFRSKVTERNYHNEPLSLSLTSRRRGSQQGLALIRPIRRRWTDGETRAVDL